MADKFAKIQDPLHGYDILPDEARLLAEWLTRVSNKLGNPEIVDGPVAWKLMDAVMKAWGAAYPSEVRAFKEKIDIELRYERPVREAVKKDLGYTPIAYPPKLYQMLKVMFPAQKLQDKKFVTQMIRRYPTLKTTNYKV